MATEKKQKSILYDENSIHKIEMVTKNVGMVYSGMGPDFRFVLVVILEVLLSQIFFYRIKRIFSGVYLCITWTNSLTNK